MRTCTIIYGCRFVCSSCTGVVVRCSRFNSLSIILIYRKYMGVQFNQAYYFRPKLHVYGRYATSWGQYDDHVSRAVRWPCDKRFVASSIRDAIARSEMGAWDSEVIAMLRNSDIHLKVGTKERYSSWLCQQINTREYNLETTIINEHRGTERLFKQRHFLATNSSTTVAQRYLTTNYSAGAQYTYFIFRQKGHGNWCICAHLQIKSTNKPVSMVARTILLFSRQWAFRLQQCCVS